MIEYAYFTALLIYSFSEWASNRIHAYFIRSELQMRPPINRNNRILEEYMHIFLTAALFYSFIFLYKVLISYSKHNQRSQWKKCVPVKFIEFFKWSYATSSATIETSFTSIEDTLFCTTWKMQQISINATESDCLSPKNTSSHNESL